MNEREKIIRLWFDMWLYQKDMGIDEYFLRKMYSIQKVGVPSIAIVKQ